MFQNNNLQHREKTGDYQVRTPVVSRTHPRPPTRQCHLLSPYKSSPGYNIIGVKNRLEESGSRIAMIGVKNRDNRGQQSGSRYHDNRGHEIAISGVKNRVGNVGGVTLSSAKMVENLTVVVDKTYTYDTWRVVIFSPRGDEGRCPDSRARGATATAVDWDPARGG